MATGYDFNLTRNQIIHRAFRIVGALSDNETLQGQMLNNGIEALNSMVKSWQQDHIFLWTKIEITRLTNIGNEEYDLSSHDIIQIDKAVIQDDGNDYDLEVISRRDYLSIPDKTSTGFPTHIACDYSLDGPNILLWPVPNDNYRLYIHAIKKLGDFDNAGDYSDFPVRWVECLVFNLAYKLSFEYPVDPQSTNRIAMEAERLKIEAKKGDREIIDCEFVRSAYD